MGYSAKVLKGYILIFCSLFIISNSYAQVITTFAGTGVAGHTGDGGPATAARLQGPYGVGTDAAGNVYIADATNFVVRKVNTSGVITNIAGTGTFGHTGDGGQATAARIGDIRAVLVDPGGNIYLADADNHCVRRINPSGVISNYAGNGTFGYTGDGGAAVSAEFEYPQALARDASGNIYICDGGNNRVRKVSTTGNVTLFAGNGGTGHTGDGSAATLAAIGTPNGVAAGTGGNIYITDGNNNYVRKVNSSGIISTIAGNGTAAYTGDGSDATAASLNNPFAITVDADGTLYIGDANNHVVRKISATGTISTIAGNGTAGYSGDSGPATAATLATPTGLALHSGYMYIADVDSQVVRRVMLDNPPVFVNGGLQAISVCGSNAINIDSMLAVYDADTAQTESWSVFTSSLHGTLTATYSTTSDGDTLIPAGLTYAPSTGYSGLDSFTISVNDGTDTIYTKVIISITLLPSAGTIMGSSLICMGSLDTLSATIVGGAWSVTNTSAAISATGIITPSSAGADTVLYIVSNGCGIDTASHIVTIVAMPVAGIITGATSLCVGGTDTASASVGSGVWSATNTDASISTDGIITASSVGSDTALYIVSNSCGADTASLSFVISGLPTAGTIAGLASLCVAATDTLSDTTTGGGWYVTNTNATITTDGVATAINPGADTVLYVVTNSCGADTAQMPLTISPLPVAGSITGDTSLCMDHSDTLLATVGGGVWSVTNANATITTEGIISAVTSGVDTILYVVTNTCGADTATLAVTILPLGACDSTSLSVGQITPVGNLSVYPNPSTGAFTIVLPATSTQATISVTDIYGKIVLQYAASTHDTKIAMNISNMPAGIYMLKVNAGNNTYYQKLILQ